MFVSKVVPSLYARAPLASAKSPSIKLSPYLVWISLIWFLAKSISKYAVYTFDFFGENIFKADLSISVKELGSLLDYSYAHKDAEEYIAKVFKSDRSLIVRNGTSTANKIVGMYSVADGDTILVDRNCHKSVTHLMMMVDVNPIYLKPTRNAYGIIGGIPRSEFSK